ncbi:MAG: hypothetical protein GY822_12395 [Deltaproteobacteria bacterium]|nr:hypothetical protein [Deltaproteobacteria bacterium]
MSKAIRALVMIWGSLSLVAAYSLSPAPSLTSLHWGIVGALFGGFCAYASRTALFFRKLREEADVLLDDQAAEYRLLRLLPRTILVVLFAGILSSAAFVVGDYATRPHSSLSFFLYFVFPVAASFALLLAKRSSERFPFPKLRSSKRSTIPYLVVDTAFPSAILTAVFSSGFAALRVASLSEVGPVFAAKHLALTTVLYGVAVGLSGFVKVLSEVKSGAVIIEKSVPKKVPGTVAFAGVMALFLLVMGPRLLPTMTLESFLLLKFLLGFFVGGGIAALGGLRALATIEYGAPRGR